MVAERRIGRAHRVSPQFRGAAGLRRDGRGTVAGSRSRGTSGARQGWEARAIPCITTHLEELCEISRELRRDRELAFYGSEDLTPSDFYKEKDAREARRKARRVVEVVARAFE